MKKFILLMGITLICFSITSESQAACNSETGKDESNADCGTWNCGTNVKCSLSKGTFTVEPINGAENVRMGNYPYGNNRPWASMLASVTHAEIKKGVISAGQSVFQGMTNLISVDMPYVTEINVDAFHGATNLTTVNMPNVESIGIHAFQGASRLRSVDLPNIKSLHLGAFGWGRLPNLTYVGVNLKYDDENDSILKNSGLGLQRSNCKTENNYVICGTCNDYVKSGAGCVKDCGKGYLGKENECINEALGCGENYRNMGGFCNRIRYTPAEAAKVAKDDGNVVTITFKK